MENSLARIVNTLEIQSKTNLVELQYDMYSMSQQRICFGSIQDFRLWAYYRRVKHFEKLSAAIFILCKKNATFTEIHDACEMLRQFAKDFEMIYGPGAVTMN